MFWEENKKIILHPYPSPNFNERPPNTTINSIIIHYTDFQTLEESLDCLTNSETKVSAHFLIDRNGDILQMVHPDYRAWHAGVSHWMGIDNFNHHSIGIELQNEGEKYFKKHKEWEPYPDPLMQSLASLIHQLKQYYPIEDRFILGHDDIAPERKIDPGPHFEWQRLRDDLSALGVSS